MEHLQQLLKDLDCPYLDEGNEEWLSDIIFSPSETRLGLLAWLLSKFDPKFEEMLDVPPGRIGHRVDSKIQKMLLLSTIAGVCQTDDVEVIQGTCSKKRQVAFWKNLIDLVSVSSQLRSSLPHTGNRDSGPLSPYACPEFLSSCRYTDTLVRQDFYASMFSPHVQLFPPDMERVIFPGGDASKKNRISLPDLAMLGQIATKLSHDTEEGLRSLSDLLQKEDGHVDVDQSVVDSKCKQLDLSLTTLTQTIETYLHYHESDIEPWCSRPRPHLSGVGPLSDSLHEKLTTHASFLTSMTRLRSESDVIATQVLPAAHESVRQDESNALDVLQSRVDILEESLLRMRSTSQR